jgi:hypothetical protein
MKKVLSCICLLTLALYAHSQIGISTQKLLQAGKPVSGEAQLLHRQMMLSGHFTGRIQTPAPRKTAIAKTQTLNMKQLGTATNSYTAIQASAHKVFAHDATDLVGWIHRQDIEKWGVPGADATIVNGIMRLDFSYNEGNTWKIDQGPLPAFRPSFNSNPRHPHVALDPGTVTNDNFNVAFVSPTVAGSRWENALRGYAVGMNSFGSRGANPTTQTGLPVKFAFMSNAQDQRHSFGPAGLTANRPGLFWYIDPVYRSAAEGAPTNSPNVYLDTVVIWRGNVVNDSTNWQRHALLTPRFTKRLARVSGVGPDPSIPDVPYPTLTGWNIAFSPDGRTGWASIITNTDTLGDGSIDKRQNQDLMFVLYKTTDYGATWQGPIEVYPRNYQEIYMRIVTPYLDIPDGTTDTVRKLSAGVTYPLDMDITVDKFGNPHIVFIASNAADSSGFASGIADPESLYYYQPGFRKAIFDLTSPDGGLTWQPIYIAAINTLSGPARGAEFIWDNYLQVSRNEAGDKIFYLWVDDTLANTYNEMVNVDLYGLGWDLNTGARTELKGFSHTDANFSGRMYFPATSPSCLTKNDGCFMLPVIITDWQTTTGDPLGQTQFWFTGNVGFCNADFNQNNDLALERVVSPGSVLCDGGTGTIPVTVKVKNTGANPVSSFGLAYRYDNDTLVIIDTILPTPLAPGASTDITFPTPMPAVAQGKTVKFGAWVVEDNDTKIANNHLAFTVTRLPGGSDLSSLPDIFAQSNITGCSTATVSVNPAYAGAQLSWTGPGGFTATGPMITVSGAGASGTYNVTADFGSCGTKTGTVNLTIQNKVTAAILGPAQATLAPGQEVTFQDNSTGSGYTRQWVVSPAGGYTLGSGSVLGDGSTSGSQTLKVTWNTLGTAIVKLITKSGCDDSVSVSYIIGTVKKDPIAAAGIEVVIYPNPTNYDVMLGVQLPRAEAVSYRLTDLTGRILQHSKLSGAEVYEQKIELNNQPAGIYILTVETPAGPVTRRIVKE